MSEERPSGAPLLTLEPLVESVRDGLERTGWELSGLQKTTSHQFEGRWEGEETRSAYLFFHREGLPDEVSVDAYLDETSRGLRGNLALVVDAPPLSRFSDVPAALAMLAAAASEALPDGYRTPLSFRAHLRNGVDDPGDAEVEIRFKLHLPRSVFQAGASAVSVLASTTASSFERLLARLEIRDLLPPGGG